MKFLIIAIIFCAGIGFGVGLMNVDQMIAEGADELNIWVSLGTTLLLWPLAMVLYWLGEQL
jgi:hypothetical protein